MTDYLMIKKEIAERLKGLMIERGLNASKLSKQAGISPKTISNWLADFFNVSVDYLI